MTAHERFIELAATAVDFELSADERRELDEHLAGCAACRAAVAELAGQRSLLAGLPAVDAPVRVRRAIHEAVASPATVGRRTVGRPAFRVALGLAVAAAPLVLALVLVRDLNLGLGFGAGAGGGAAPEPRVAWQQLEVGPEGTARPEPSAAPSAPPASGAPASGGPRSERTELLAVAFTDRGAVAVGRACDPATADGDCRAAAIVIDALGEAIAAGPGETLDVEPLADGSWAGMRGVTAGPGGIVAVGATGVDGRASAAVWRSDDGLSWERGPSGPGFPNAWMNAVIALSDGTYVAVGGASDPAGGASDPAGVSAAAWTSADGLSWVRAVETADLLAGTNPGVDHGRPVAGMWDVAVADGRIVAAGTTCTGSAGCVASTWTSTDGLRWTRVPGDGLAPGSAAAVTAADGAALIVGAGRTSALSWWLESDGSVQQQALPPARAGRLLAAASAAGRVVAAGEAGPEAGGVWFASDGRWTFAGDERLGGAIVRGIAIDGDQLVVVGAIETDGDVILVGRIEDAGA